MNKSTSKGCGPGQNTPAGEDLCHTFSFPVSSQYPLMTSRRHLLFSVCPLATTVVLSYRTASATIPVQYPYQLIIFSRTISNRPLHLWLCNPCWYYLGLRSIPDIDLVSGRFSECVRRKPRPLFVRDFYGTDMTRITSLRMKRPYNDAQFNTIFESREPAAIAETGGSTLNENEEGRARKRRKRSGDDTDGFQTNAPVGNGVVKGTKLGKKRFAGEFSRAKMDGARRCSYT